MAEQECDSKADEPITSVADSSPVETTTIESTTVDTEAETETETDTETYDNYLGDETGK